MITSILALRKASLIEHKGSLTSGAPRFPELRQRIVRV